MALTRNLAWMGLGQAVFFLLQFAGSVVLARLLTPYEMGVYALAAALVGILSVVQSFGMGAFIVREATLGPDDVATAFTINVLISLTLAVTILVLGLTSGHFYSNPGVARVLLVLSVLPLISIFELVPYASLERDGRFKLLVTVGMAKNLTSTTITVGSAFAGASYLSFAYGQVAGGVVGVLVLNAVGRQHIHFRLALTNWRRLTLFGANMLAISGVNAAATRLSDVLLGKLLGLSALGLYNRATNVYRLFWDNLHLVIGRVLFVDLAQRKRRAESLRESYLIILEVMTAALWPAFAGLAVLSPPLFHFVYGPKWVGAAVPFSLIAVSAIIQVSITMTWEIFTICGETARQARIEFARTSIGVLMFALGCLVNLTVATATRVLEIVVSAIFYRNHLARMTETSTSDFLPIYGRSALLTFLAIAPSGILMWTSRWSPETPIWQVFGAIAVGVALWALGLLLMRHPILTQLRNLVSGSGLVLRKT